MQKIFYRLPALSMLIAISMLSSGCIPKMLAELEKSTFAGQLVKPRPWGMAETPEGPPLYQKGWNHGCDSGLNVYGNSRYKASYEFTQDWRLVDNRDYYSGWKQGYGYCRWYTYNWVRPWRE